MQKVFITSILVVLLLVLCACGGPSQKISDKPTLAKVAEVGSIPAAEEDFPIVEKLSEVGTNFKQIDLSQFDYVLVEAEGSTMQLAISWWDKKWEFRGTCDHTKMRLWLVMGEKSIKEFEPNEWVLIPPATMTLVFQRTTGTWTDTRSPSITCSNLKWTIDK